MTHNVILYPCGAIYYDTWYASNTNEEVGQMMEDSIDGLVKRLAAQVNSLAEVTNALCELAGVLEDERPKIHAVEDIVVRYGTFPGVADSLSYELEELSTLLEQQSDCVGKLRILAKGRKVEVRDER